MEIDGHGNYGIKDYIDEWLQSLTRLIKDSLIQFFLVQDRETLLVPHRQEVIHVPFPYLDMSFFAILLRTWLH